ncbi:cytochrome oxidase complex assembly protein 1-domain-containing protein [Nemania sp. FL0916]|nr:cytochrome oxidase complex assembly protein 1-domain-containing protein [Nemania sp. FL0916]
MLTRIIRKRAALSFRGFNASLGRSLVQRRTLIPAPKEGSGPLMERRADRELPNINEYPWRRTLPIFIAVMALASAAIFNYQKLSSPVVASTLYALRTSETARELLGDEIYYKHRIPWIRGELNQLQGRIDIRFAVKGSRAAGVMRFASVRPSPRSGFKITEWSLETEDGVTVNLMDDEGTEDPFMAMAGQPMDEEERRAAMDTRGFRQQVK